MSTPATPHERSRARLANLVLKSGSLLISSKGLGWKSWKRRWFVLTHTSLVFYKSDPTALSKGGESILALGGIDLNSSGSVLVKADKKLLTVLFPDGRAFTLKAETTEDLEEWKDSLERAISAAPSPDVVMGHSGIFKTDSIDTAIELVDIGRSRKPVKSMVVGRPILLALEDIDGSPSFLEKALCFIEQHGVGVEGILRQSADVDEVEQRVRDYEQGKIHFDSDEDAHVIGDCIKHVLRELPSLPVPTPCCSALLEAQRCARKESQILAMKAAVSETFPEPNRRLLQRVLKMMCTVALHSFKNRMTASAVAACMAPLLLKPLLTGECGLEDDSDISGDNSAQLLAAAAAANSAQAIITTLLEEYDRIFEEDLRSSRHSPSAYPKVEDTASEASSDGEVLQVHDDDYQEVEEQDQELDEDPERLLSGSMSESSGNEGSDVYDSKAYEDEDSEDEQHRNSRTSHGRSSKVLSRSVNLGNSRGLHEGHMEVGMLSTSTLGLDQSRWNNKFTVGATPRAGVSNYTTGTSSSRTVGAPTVTSSSRRSSLWGLSATKKTPEAVLSGEEELVIQRLEATRNDLRNKIAKEAKGNAALQQSLERRKQALHDRRLVLEQDVTRLQEQLQAERELRAALEIGLSMSASQFPLTRKLDAKTRVEFEEIAVAEADVARLKQRVSELHAQLSQHRQQNNSSVPVIHERHQWAREQQNVLHEELCDQEGQCQHTKEGQNRHDHASALEQMMMQQRNALEAAKEVLKVERARGTSLRKQAAQQELTTCNDWRTLRSPVAPLLSDKQFSWRRRHDAPNNFDLRESEVMPPHMNDVNSLNDTMLPTGKRNFADVEKTSAAAMYQRQQVTSSALAELTSRLDFFKEKRSQLVEQLQSLDSSLTPSHDLLCSSSPPWTTRPG